MISKQRKISINYRPLQISGDIEVVGSIPDLQVYQADKNEYTPDYTLTPLSLFPRCNATDPDAVKKVGVVNSKLTNMKWYERIGTVRTLITSSSANYSITESGENKGLIMVRKNSSTINPITLEFYAEYVDSRTGQTHVYRFTRLIRTIDGTDAVPVLMIDSPSSVDWNPCRDITKQTITAKLMVGDMDVTNTGKCKFFFYRVLSTGALEQIVDGTGDNDWEFVSLNNNVLVVDRDYIGYGMTYVCKASYAQEGSPSATPDSSIASVSTAIRRRIPTVECDWSGVPQGVADGTLVIYPKPIIGDTLGSIPNPSLLFDFKWYTKASGSSTYMLAAIGYAPNIPFTDGMMLKLEVNDRGPWAAVVSEGAYILDEKGRFVMARKN